jgi:quercetin dioxygenase-like cupin family protein
MTATQPEAVEVLERINTYEQFLRDEGIPVVRGFAVEDLRTVPVEPWARRGVLGTYIVLDGTGGTNDAYVCEIPPGGAVNPQRQLFEEMIYVLDGNGSTQVWYDERRKVSFEWKAGSLFAIPLNAWHRHFNGRGDRPARFLAVTNAPVVINLFHNLDFVFNTPFTFDDRFAGQENYFDGEGRLWRNKRNFVLETNFVPDTHSIELYTWKERGAGGRNIMFELAHNTMAAHISEFPVGTYKKAHRHGPGRVIVIPGGEGYSIMWQEGEEKVVVPWHEASLFVPPQRWFHQHFNVGAKPARYLAFHPPMQFYGYSEKIEDRARDQIEYPDEDPWIRQHFEAELARRGLTSLMPEEAYRDRNYQWQQAATA